MTKQVSFETIKYNIDYFPGDEDFDHFSFGYHYDTMYNGLKNNILNLKK